MEISGFPRGGVHVSKGGCTCKQKGCTGRCSLHEQRSLKEVRIVTEKSQGRSFHILALQYS